MRFFIVLSSSLFCLGFIALQGQEPPLPQGDANPSATPAAAPSLAMPPPQLIPDDVLPPPAPAAAAPDVRQLDEAFKQGPLTPASAEYRLRVEWRKLRNVVMNDLAIKAARANAERARTDLEKRKRLAAYYQLLYTKLTALAQSPELKAYLAVRREEKLQTLPQPRVRPGFLPTAAAKPRPSPAAQKQTHAPL